MCHNHLQLKIEVDWEGGKGIARRWCVCPLRHIDILELRPRMAKWLNDILPSRSLHGKFQIQTMVDVTHVVGM